VISIKRYMEGDWQSGLAPRPAVDALAPVALSAIQQILLAIGKEALTAWPAVGSELQAGLIAVQQSLAVAPTCESVVRAQTQTEQQLSAWSHSAREHVTACTEEVKDLLLLLTNTASAVSSASGTQERRFTVVMARLREIHTLDDIGAVRSAVEDSVVQLTESIASMVSAQADLVSHLRSQIAGYETKLHAANTLASRDPLTGVATRRATEKRVLWSLQNRQPFCVVMLDLNHFKAINDRWGHGAGDDLLRQIAAELLANTRSGDFVGRWGGDEFLLILDCDADGAKARIDRLRQWVFGKYSITTADGETVELQVDASIGIAVWRTGMTLKEIIAAADSSMYRDKRGVCDPPEP
jgi:diguanylate cyclase (GGDEF)-like protein